MKKLLIVLMLLAARAEAAITFDTAATGYANSTSVSFAVAPAGCANSTMIASVSIFNTGGFSVGSATFNGVSMTKAVGNNTDGAQATVEQWYLNSPASGSHTFTVNVSGGSTHTGAVVTTYCGVDISGSPVRNSSFVSTTGASSPTVLAVTSVSGDWVVDAVYIFATSVTVSGGQTDRGQISIAGAHLLGSSTKTATTTSTSLGWTYSGTPNWSACEVSLKPATATTNLRTLMGVGGDL